MSQNQIVNHLRAIESQPKSFISPPEQTLRMLFTEATVPILCHPIGSVTTWAIVGTVTVKLQDAVLHVAVGRVVLGVIVVVIECYSGVRELQLLRSSLTL